MKIREIKALSVEELLSKKQELQKELIKVRAQVATGTTPKSPGQLRKIRRGIAQINTIMKIKKSEDMKKV